MLLSYNKNDIEQLCGFKSKKFTMVNYVFTGIIGVFFTIIFYALLLPFHLHNMQFANMYFHGGPMDRSTIPYYIMFLTCWSLAILLIKYLKLQNQRRAFAMNILPEDPNFVLTARTTNELLDQIYLQIDQPKAYVLVARIELALVNLKNQGNVNAVSECMNNQAANDEEYLASSYTILKGFIWAIPVLGFIGTVIGLAKAVGEFGSVVSTDASLTEMKNALGQVTGGLAIAFETTLIALVMALIVQLLAKFVLSKEEVFLDECADYCNCNIAVKIKNINLDSNSNI